MKYFLFALPKNSEWIVVIAILSILFFWIMMIVDASKRNFIGEYSKILWMVGIIIFGPIGALIYSLLRKSF